MVIGLFVKPAPKAEMRSMKVLELASNGILGDASARELTPRQVLLVDEECLLTLGFARGDLRENIVLRGFNVQGLKSGTTLRIGNDVNLRITFECEPCAVVIARLRQPAPRIKVKDLNGARGMLATVSRGGIIREGDSVHVVQDCLYEELHADVKGRVCWLLAKVPPGKVVTYTDILALVGAPTCYARALPRMLKSGISKDHSDTSANSLPIHRIVDSSGALIEKHVPWQSKLLGEEGIKTDEKNRVDLTVHRWVPPSGASLYLQPVG